MIPSDLHSRLALAGGSWIIGSCRAHGRCYGCPPISALMLYSCAYRDGLFVLGHKSGDITFLGVDRNYRPPE